MIAWIDIETTGLDERNGALLEIAVLATDDQLVEVHEGPALVVVPPQPMPLMEAIVREMHMHSGLLDAIGRPDFCVPLVEAERRCIDFFTEIAATMSGGGEARGVLRRTPLAGSSVHFDRRWLRHHMPRLEGLFSYRIIDVSTVKECAQRWAPKVYDDRPKATLAHRALPDVKQSVSELRHYQGRLFDGLEAQGVVK